MGKFSKNRGGRDSGKGGNRSRGGGGRDRSDSRDGNNKRDNLKVERRDGSKGIKKGDNPRKITTGQLRREQGKSKGDRDGDRGSRGGRGDRGKTERGGKGGRGGRPFRKGGRKEERPKTADALDREMENYWVKAGNKDQANERLDDDLANYFTKNAVVPAEVAAEGKEVAKVEEEKKE